MFYSQKTRESIDFRESDFFFNLSDFFLVTNTQIESNLNDIKIYDKTFKRIHLKLIVGTRCVFLK